MNKFPNNLLWSCSPAHSRTKVRRLPRIHQRSPQVSQALIRATLDAKEGDSSSYNTREENQTGTRIYRSGEVVPESGIYDIVHHQQHREPHSATLISGDLFPSCEVCEQAMGYRLVRTAPYIFHDDDFYTPE